jgi:hypothetical protein
LRAHVDVSDAHYTSTQTQLGVAAEARNDHELPHVLEHAVVLATGPMLEAASVWLSSLDAALLPVRLGGSAIRGSSV